MFTMTTSRAGIFLCAGLALCAKIGSAQSCQVSSISGNYSYSAIGSGIPGSFLTPSSGTVSPGVGTGTPTTGSGSATVAFSNTELGRLLGGVGNTVPFSSAGMLYFDGFGGVRAYPTVQGGASMSAGTYVINPDCTITVTLTDVFGTNKTASSLQGIILSGGSEIDLGVFQTASTTTGGTATGGTPTTTTSGTVAVNQSSSLIRLVRSFSFSCNASNLVGPYALIASGAGATSIANNTGTGTGTTSAQTVAPFFLFGRVNFDGVGNITADPGNFSLSSLRYTGTYTVNSDCTGTMTLSKGSPSTSTTGSGSTGSGSTTGTTSTDTSANLSLNFVLVQPSGPFSEAASISPTKPVIQFSVANGTQALYGYGRAQ
jgi:hypothetical protein